jgi:hypothetical protein
LNACIFSSCRQYRYALDHDEDDLFSTSRGYAAWIGLNPSIADESQLDPTLRRISGFTRQFGFHRFVILNLFALVSKDPKVMLNHPDPIGPDNDQHILRTCETATAVICCWGGHGIHWGRADSILELLTSFNLNCLGVTSDPAMDNRVTHCICRGTLDCSLTRGMCQNEASAACRDAFGPKSTVLGSA